MPKPKTKPKPPTAIFLMGPTASGKTDLAINIADAFPVELISVDSSQVYRGMDIGTAKPSAALLKRYPHRLIDIREPDDPYSAADFCIDAIREMDQIVQAGRIPLLVGGTMFYFHALEYGLSTLPGADAETRNRLSRQAESAGWPAMHQRLAAVDPVIAERLNPNDGQRIQRALELFEVTGRPPSEIMAESEAQPCAYATIKIAIVPADRKRLHERIEARFRAMLAQGLVAEVDNLLKNRGIDPQITAMRMVGYRQVADHLLRGDTDSAKTDESAMIDRGVAATRQLAKRQLTWLRSYPGVECFNSEDVGVKQAIFTYLRNRLEYT